MSLIPFHRDRNFLYAITLLLLCTLSSGSFASTADVEEVRSIARLYSAAFDREPKVGGLNFWVDAYEGGRSLVSIANKFYVSPEFISRYGPLDDRQYIEQLFRNVLGREGAESGITFWVNKLAGSASRAVALARFADSPENITKTRETFANMHFANDMWSYDEAPQENYWKQLLKEIKSGEFTSDQQMYTHLPDVPNCDPGSLTELARNRALEVLNHVRELHGLYPVQYESFHDAEAQSSALVQRANNYLSHFPEPGDKCYSALAASGSASSNLSLRGGSGNEDPANDILGWTHDRYNAADLMAAGHRRWVLHPELGYLAYGQVKGAAAQKVFEFGVLSLNSGAPYLEFVAYPYQNYPYVLAENTGPPTPWSLSMVPAVSSSPPFDYFSGAVITVKEKASGKLLTVRNQYSDTQGFGISNFLSWLVDDYQYDTEYTVEVSNIRMPGGDIRTVEYFVNLEYFNIVTVEEPLEAGDSKVGNEFRGSFQTGTDADSYVAELSGVTRFEGQSIFSNQAFFILLYDERKQLVRSSDVAFQENLTPGSYTVVVSPCDEDGVCYQGVEDYTVIIN